MKVDNGVRSIYPRGAGNISLLSDGGLLVRARPRLFILSLAILPNTEHNEQEEDKIRVIARWNFEKRNVGSELGNELMETT